MNKVERVNATFEPTWESLRQYRSPDWYMNAKFGIFIHWGVYSVPAFNNEWYPRNMYAQGTLEFEHHVKTYGPQARFGYKDFIPKFTAEKFDAGAWAQLFKEAGARYVVPVAEHHDGFAMYDSAHSNWTASKMGPKRDILKELSEAIRQRNMVFGVSSHRAEHWWFMDGGRKFASDVQDPAYADFYGPAQTASPTVSPDSTAWKSTDWRPRPDGKFLEDWLARCCELVDRYQPQLFWFDWWIGQVVFEPYVQRFAAYYYNQGEAWRKGVAINYEEAAFEDGTAILDIERGQLGAIRPLLWQNDTGVAKHSWGYVHNQDYKTADNIIGDLIDVVSKNGCLLLNIGPGPDGTIPEPEQAILREIGRWLSVNGEAIYDTRPWQVYGEGPTQISEGAFTDTRHPAFTANDIRFTYKANALYAICLARPGDELIIRSLAGSSTIRQEQVEGVWLLGKNERLNWTQDEQGLRIQVPAERPFGTAVTFKISLRGEILPSYER